MPATALQDQVLQPPQVLPHQWKWRGWRRRAAEWSSRRQMRGGLDFYISRANRGPTPGQPHPALGATHYALDPGAETAVACVAVRARSAECAQRSAPQWACEPWLPTLPGKKTISSPGLHPPPQNTTRGDHGVRERQSRRDGGERSRLRFRTVRLCAKRGPQLSWWGFISKCGFCTVIDLWTACQKEETVTATSCWFTFSLEKAYFSLP